MEIINAYPVAITLFLAGLFVIVAGFLLFRFPPRNINSFYGYRTNSSKQSQQHWDFAQKYGGKQLILWGIVEILFSLVALVFGLNNFLWLLVLLLIAAGPILVTEIKLKGQSFDEN